VRPLIKSVDDQNTSPLADELAIQATAFTTPEGLPEALTNCHAVRASSREMPIALRRWHP
jgi:hypothetical protein